MGFGFDLFLFSAQLLIFKNVVNVVNFRRKLNLSLNEQLSVCVAF